ncbi:ABC transporter substrate-binding protein [Parasulfitobacter algicola]|nr:ABC transporter substrate-binding protein [Sulfitobacter algicola]
MADLVIPSLTYRTGPYGGSGVPYSDGFTDYLTLLNERDGGINGQRIEVVECEYGYNTDKGLECFEETYAKGALVYHPMSTGLTYKLIPIVHERGVPLHTMGYGLTAAADGGMFPYTFNFPAHYWHAASAQIRHLKEISGGSLQGKKIVHMYHNSGYGKEPIPTLEKLALREGFELKLAPIDHPGENQDAAWEEMKAYQPDFILLWGWGIMNEVALKKAVNMGMPLDRVIGVWWSANESDIKPLRQYGEGYKAVTFHAVGTSFKIFNDMNMLVYQTGKARGDLNNIGDVLYNRGVMAAMFATEAIRLAMEIHDTTDVTRSMVRDGFEQLKMDEAKFEELGMEGFIPGVEISCANHAGEGLVSVKQWDSFTRRWVQLTDYYQPDAALIDPQVAAASEAFASSVGMNRKGCS